jgi:predicted amidohydrolase YtcJ
LARAISVRSGHVAAVGDDVALLKDAAPTTKLIDLKGCSVLPDFFGAHPHADREGSRREAASRLLTAFGRRHR